MKRRIIALFLAFSLLCPFIFSSVALEGDKEPAPTPKSTPFDYNSLYVDDSLVISFSAYDKTAGDAPTALTDSLGNSFTVGANAVYGDGALLNRGTVVDFTAAQGTKLNNSSYTYEFVLGYEDQVASEAGSTLGECFDIGVLKYKITYASDAVTIANAYMKIGSTSNAWIYDYGATTWTTIPLLDTETAGEIIELSQTGKLTAGSAPMISFTTYRQGKNLGTVSSNSTYETGFKYSANLSFKIGKNLNMKIYAVRAYSDLLTDAERAQNHFADVAGYYGLDVSGYLTLKNTEQAKIHKVFSSVRIDDTVGYDMQAYLDMLVTMKGNAPSVPLEEILSFDGYAVKIWEGSSVRAEFSVNQKLLEDAFSQDYIIECGGVVAPADAEGDLIVYDEESTYFLPADPSYLQTVSYCSDFAQTIPEKVVAETQFSQEEALLYRNDELVFKAYIGITDFENSYIFFFDAESERFGDTVSMNTLYEHFVLNGYESYPSVFSFVDEKILNLLDIAGEKLDEARAQLALVEESLKDIKMLKELTNESYNASQTEGRAAYDAYTDAYTAYLANRARKAAIKDFPQKLVYLYEAIANVHFVIINELKDKAPTEEQDYYANAFTDALLTRYEELLIISKDLELSVDPEASTLYENALFKCTQNARPSSRINKTLNFTALEDYLVYADPNDHSGRLLVETLLSEYGMLLPLLPLELQKHVDKRFSSIILDPELSYEVYGQSVLEMTDDYTLTLYGNTQNGVYHAVLKLLDLFSEHHKVTLEGKTIVKAQDVLNQTYAVDSFFLPDGSLNTESEEPLTIVCIGGSLTELGKKWVQTVKEYFEKRFPNRPVTIYNAGVGGTGSKLGAARFEHDVLSLNPDLVLIEFSTNDASQTEANSKHYLENMIYMCQQAEKIPAVVYAHTPQAADETDELYEKYCRQVKWKGEVAAHYGISVVDIYQYFFRCYEAKKAETGNYDLTYLDYISDFYKKQDDGTYDVHPISTGRGYDMYAEAFIEAFDRDLASMLTRLKYTDILSENKDNVLAGHNYLPYNSDRITYEGTWETWTLDNKYNNADANAMIGNHRYVYPFMDLGVRRAYKQSGAALSFKTTASELSFYYHGAKAGSGATVYVNGQQAGTVTTKTGAQQPFQTVSVSLGNPSGNEVTVRVVIDEPTAEQYVFQFGYIIETFKATK